MGIDPSVQSEDGKGAGLPPSRLFFEHLPSEVMRKILFGVAMQSKNSSLLDAIETSGISNRPGSYRGFCISHCKDEYTASVHSYIEFSNDRQRDYLTPLENCKTFAHFARNVHTGKVKVLSSSCKLRWCPLCASTRRWFLTGQISEWLKETQNPKFLTLTLQHSEDSLDDQIEHLYYSFLKYRKLDLLKRSILGGVWFFQIHKSTTDNLWHPHLHCVIDSPWLDQFKLSASWEMVTKTSKIINIKEVEDPEAMSEYVARYAARPSLLSSCTKPDRLELMNSLHGRRLVGTWASARSISLRPSKPPDSSDWKNVGSFGMVMELLDTDFRAKGIWISYLQNTDLPEDYNLLEIDNFIDDVHVFNCSTIAENYQLLLGFY